MGNFPAELLAKIESHSTLTDEDLGRILALIGEAGFDPNSVVRRKGITTEENHFVRHREEWPNGTTLVEYVDSGRIAALAATAVMFSHYLGEPQITLFTPSGVLRGIDGGPWIMLEYRIGLGHWVTLHQPWMTLQEIVSDPRRSEVMWLRRPKE